MMSHHNTGKGTKKGSPRESNSKSPRPSSNKKKINCKAKGTRFENEVKEQLQEQGFHAVRQSNSQFPDIIAISPDREVHFIECKTQKYLTQQERDLLLEQPYGNPFVAYPMYSGKKKHIAYYDMEKYRVQIAEKEKIYIDELPLY